MYKLLAQQLPYLSNDLEFSLESECLEIGTQLHLIVDGNNVCRQTLERLLLLRHDWSHSMLLHTTAQNRRVWSPRSLTHAHQTTYTAHAARGSMLTCNVALNTYVQLTSPAYLRVEYFDLCVCSGSYCRDRTSSKIESWDRNDGWKIVSPCWTQSDAITYSAASQGQCMWWKITIKTNPIVTEYVAGIHHISLLW